MGDTETIHLEGHHMREPHPSTAVGVVVSGDEAKGDPGHLRGAIHHRGGPELTSHVTVVDMVVRHAHPVGIRLDRLPFHPSVVLKALQEKGDA